MAGLCWMAVVLAVFLSAENSLAAVDQNRLAAFVDGVLSKYQPTQGMFSLALSIPEDQNQNPADILQQVFQSDTGNNVKNKIESDGVYYSSRVIAAKALKGSHHAESRVLDHLHHLVNNQNDLLLFYSFASPCPKICTSYTDPASILGRINTIRQWSSYAVVFSKVFKPKVGEPITDIEQSKALQRLAEYPGTRGPIGLHNIFRCDRQNGRMQCASCSSGNQVSHYCISDDPKSGPSQNLPQQGKGGSSSQGGKGRGGRGRGWGGNQGGGGGGGVGDQGGRGRGGVGDQGGRGRGWGGDQGGGGGGRVGDQGGRGRGWGGNQGGSGRGWSGDQGGGGGGGVGDQGGRGRGWGGNQGGSGRGWSIGRGGSGRGWDGGRGGGGKGWSRGRGGGGKGWSRGRGGGGKGWSRSRGRSGRRWGR